MNGESKLILGLVWTLIGRYQMGAEADNALGKNVEKPDSGERGLVQWLNSIGVPVNNVTTEYVQQYLHCIVTILHNLIGLLFVVSKIPAT